VRIFWGVLVFAVIAPTYASLLKTSVNWDPDGFMYTRMMLVDRGYSEEQAYAEASRFYLAQKVARDPTVAVLYGAHPPRFFVTQYALFRARVLYPWLGALLYPKFGLEALWIISAACVSLAAVGLFAILCFGAPPWLAALGTVAAMGYPLMHELGAAAGTDAMAFLEWTVFLAAMMAYARRPRAAWFVVAVVAAALMGVTRPAIWLPVGAAAGLFVFAHRSGDTARRAAALRMLVAQAVVALGALGYTAFLHGAGFLELVRWQYAWHVDRHGHWTQYGIVGWYALFALRGFVIEPVWLAAAGTPVLAIAAGAMGLWRRRDDPAVAVLVGAAAIAPLAILANPPDFARALEIPVVPTVMFGVVALIADALRAPRAPRPLPAT
jgi:hypothetical protein